jgi:hypothetical protein
MLVKDCLEDVEELKIKSDRAQGATNAGGRFVDTPYT